jgi:transcriptional regulator GlxA family with amidase domain
LGGNVTKVDDYQRRQILILPAFNIGSSQDLERLRAGWQPAIAWLRNNIESFDLVVAGCSGVFLLAETGLLKGETVTTSWWLERQFQRQFKDQGCVLEEGALCVRSGRFITGGGSSSFYDVVLRLVQERAGKHMARLLAKYLLVDNQRLSQAPYAILGQVDNEDPVVSKAERWIRKHLAEDFRIEDIADHCAVSSRTLIRRFQRAMSESPQTFTQRLRIEKSKILLETTQLRLSEIVRRVGYNDESAFRRLFKKYCKVSPREYRRRFNPAVVSGNEAA